MVKNEVIKDVKSKKEKNGILFFLIIIFLSIFIRLYANDEKNFMYKGKYDVIGFFNDEYEGNTTFGKTEFPERVNTYQEYLSTLEGKLKTKYDSNFFKNNSLVLVPSNEIEALYSVKEQGNTVTIGMSHYKTIGYAAMPTLFIIPVSKNIINVNIIQHCNKMGNILKSIANFCGIGASVGILIIYIKKSNKRKRFIVLILAGSIILLTTIFILNRLYVRDTVAYKPVIYLYPKTEENICVKLDKPNKITCSYPKYINGWNVLAKPNGDLTEIDSGRKLYSLYYENQNSIIFNMTKYGFVIKGEDTAKFLEEKLAILGLNEREAEEFIIYWLPKLETNKYNYIRFATKDEISKNMQLKISPKPDTIIRVLMVYKKLNKPIHINEQKLITPERNGFVSVEWGGTEIK